MTIYVQVGKKLTDSYDLSSTQFELSGDTTLQIPSGVFQTDGDYLPGADQVVTYGTTPTVNFASGAVAGITMTGTITTLTISGINNGDRCVLLLTQAGAGSFVVTTWVGVNVWLLGGVAPTLTTTSGKTDAITFVKHNDLVYGAITIA